MIQVIGNMKLKSRKNFHLTLSLHGMQFGIETQVILSELGSVCLCTMGWFCMKI
jgi:hypothetical protein